MGCARSRCAVLGVLTPGRFRPPMACARCAQQSDAAERRREEGQGTCNTRVAAAAGSTQGRPVVDCSCACMQRACVRAWREREGCEERTCSASASGHARAVPTARRPPCCAAVVRARHRDDGHLAVLRGHNHPDVRRPGPPRASMRACGTGAVGRRARRFLAAVRRGSGASGTAIGVTRHMSSARVWDRGRRAGSVASRRRRGEE